MKTLNKTGLATALMLAAGSFLPVHAAPTGAAVAAPLSEGEIRKVDKENGKLTIKHGELKNLGMPPMTMVFRVGNPALLDQLNTGDKVRFTAEKIDGQFTVTAVEVRN